MNQILSFYYGSHPDHRGRTLAEMLKQDDYWLEVTHDYIQWLFPLSDLSRASSHAPIIDNKTRDTFRNDEILQKHMRAALVRMLRVFGLTFNGATLSKAVNWHERKSEWFTAHTHNSLRITRILKSMTLLGLQKDAAAVLAGIEALCVNETDCGVSEQSRKFWREAIEKR